MAQCGEPLEVDDDATFGELVVRGPNLFTGYLNDRAATAAAIHRLRADHPALPVIGVEPALKPAVALSRTGHIAVMATRVTVESRKFETLRASLAGHATFHIVPCDGLAGAIEQSDPPRIAALCEQYAGVAGRFGIEPGQIDTLVLGCTHYPLLARTIGNVMGRDVVLVSGADETAFTVRSMLDRGPDAAGPPAQPRFLTSGDPAQFRALGARFLGPEVRTVEAWSWS